MTKAISVRQPWAWALFHGKDIENRDWPTMYRGALFIHAAKGLTVDEYLAAAYFCKQRGVIVPPMPELVRGAVLGRVQLHSCVSSSESPWFEGRYGFVIRQPRLLTRPIPMRGQLGLWEFELPYGATEVGE